jgi:large subunit ribosomal protein L3
MTQIFEPTGIVVPVTVIEAGPCAVVQVRTPEKEGYQAVQLGFGEKKAVRASKAEVGHAAKAGLSATPQVLREFSVAEGEEAPAVGDQITVGMFEVGTRIKVTGTTKGRGFQGVVKRHGFGGGRASHGATRVHRAPGSIGAGTNPSRVIKGKRMPGHMGNEQQTVRNLRVAKIDAERNLLYVRGAVPGPTNGYVFITKQ